MTNVKQPRSLRASMGAAAAASVIGALAAAPAHAKDAGLTPIRDIIVTGERQKANPYADPEAPYKVDRSASGKFTEPLADTPKSISILPKEAIKDLGATSFRDIARTQPGVTLGTGEGGNAYGDRIFIRGFDARNDIYVDGVRDPGVGSRETFAVEQIEIVKGPSSTFGGRGTTGGAANLVSKKPTDSNWGDIEATIGTDNTQRLTLDTNRKLTDDLTMRVNAMGHKSHIAGRDAVYNDRWGAAVALQYKPTDQLTLGADYYHLSTDELPDWGVPYDNAHNRPFDVRRDNFYGIVDRDFRKVFADIYTLNGEYRVSDALKIHGVLRYGQTGNAYVASAPERPNTTNANPNLWTVNANAKRRDAVTGSWAGQLDATWDVQTGIFEHTLVFGVDASKEEVVNRQRASTECATLPCVGASTSPVQNLLNPNPYRPWAVNDGGVLSRSDVDVESLGVYAIDTIKMGEKWRATVGVRRDSYKIDFSQITYATGVVARRSNDVDFWNWHLGLVYKPKSNVSLYAAYGSSSNPSGEQLDSTALDYGGLDARTSALDPERNKSYEVGAKWNVFDEHLALTAALFRIEKENARVAINNSTVALVGEQRADGVELTAGGNLTHAWSMFGGVTILNAKTTDSPIAAAVGSKFPNVPKTSYSLTTRYQVTDKAHLGATATYNSKRYGGTTMSLATYIPDYTRVDLFGGYQLTDNIEVSFNVLNLTDETYYDAIYRSATPFTYIAPGRSALLKVDIDF